LLKSPLHQMFAVSLIDKFSWYYYMQIKINLIIIYYCDKLLLLNMLVNTFFMIQTNSPYLQKNHRRYGHSPQSELNKNFILFGGDAERLNVLWPQNIWSAFDAYA